MTIPDSAYAVDHDLYADELLTECTQCAEEGLDTAPVAPIFRAAADLPRGDVRSRIADALFHWTQTAPIADAYAYREPSSKSNLSASLNRLHGMYTFCKAYGLSFISESLTIS